MVKKSFARKFFEPYPCNEGLNCDEWWKRASRRWYKQYAVICAAIGCITIPTFLYMIDNYGVTSLLIPTFLTGGVMLLLCVVGREQDKREIAEENRKFYEVVAVVDTLPEEEQEKIYGRVLAKVGPL